MADTKPYTEAQRRTMHNGYADYVTTSNPDAAEWELWQAACEWAWKNPRRSLGKAAAGVPETQNVSPKGGA
jgi:hypothetical protein